MRIIGIDKNYRFKALSLKLMCGACLILTAYVLTGCTQRSDLEKAKNDVQQSGYYYQQAVSKYKSLLNKGGNLSRLYLELGMLYYEHGDFENAVAAFQKTNDPGAQKFLAISYYRLGQFTDALEVFDKIKGFVESIK